VPDRALRRAARREYGVQLCAGTVAGLLSGAGTALLVGTPIAHLGQVGTLAPASGDLGWTELVAVGLVSGVLFGLLSVACARAGLRFADPDVLRGAQT
jgi:hypothetical protein